MNAANDRKSAKIVALDGARPPREVGAPDLGTAGAMLRAARTDAGYSLDEIEDEINVKADRLAAIEVMDLSALPSAPYALGFVRAYADFLGLPVEPLVARFREQAGWSKAVTAPKVTAPPPVSRDREVGLVGILVVLGFIVWALWQIVGKSPPEEEASLPSGFPIADRTEVPQVVSEVTTSLEDELSRTPPLVVADAPLSDPAPTSPPSASLTVPPIAVPGGTPARRFPPLAPLVLALPWEGRAAPDPAPATTPPSVAEPSASRAETLNERLLREVMADDGTDRQVAEDLATREQTQPEPADPTQQPRVRARAAPSVSSPTIAEPAEQPVPAPTETRVAAVLTDPVSPVYPRRCRRRAADEEVVMIRYNVSRFGRVTGLDVMSSTNDCFDEAALAAASRFGFDPATAGGRAVAENGRTSRIVFRAP